MRDTRPVATPARSLTRESLGAWLVKSSLDIRSEVATISARCVRKSYRTALVEAGQPVLLWLSGGAGLPAGIYGHGRTTGPVALTREDGPVMPVRLAALDAPVLRRELLDHPVLSRLEVVRMPAGSNPSFVTSHQLDVLCAYRHQLADA
jgi:hypothetical protein